MLINIDRGIELAASPRGKVADHYFYVLSVSANGAHDRRGVSKHWIPWMLANRPDGILGHIAYDRIMAYGLYAFGLESLDIQVHHELHAVNGDDPEHLVALTHRLHNVV